MKTRIGQLSNSRISGSDPYLGAGSTFTSTLALFALASLAEGIPVSVMEAMAMPVIVTDVRQLGTDRQRH